MLALPVAAKERAAVGAAEERVEGGRGRAGWGRVGYEEEEENEEEAPPAH